jgi:hypothetical protein
VVSDGEGIIGVVGDRVVVFAFVGVRFSLAGVTGGCGAAFIGRLGAMGGFGCSRLKREPKRMDIRDCWERWVVPKLSNVSSDTKLSPSEDRV